MTDGGETMLVAECEGAVAGFASIKGATLFGLYVDPTRGRGAGRLLLEQAEDLVRRTRCRRPVTAGNAERRAVLPQARLHAAGPLRRAARRA